MVGKYQLNRDIVNLSMSCKPTLFNQQFFLYVVLSSKEGTLYDVQLCQITAEEITTVKEKQFLYVVLSSKEGTLYDVQLYHITTELILGGRFWQLYDTIMLISNLDIAYVTIRHYMKVHSRIGQHV